METKPTSSGKPFDYGIGALAVLVISIGVAAIIYALGMIPFNILYFLAVIFGPLGVYTLVYSFIAGKEATYYLVWGTIMFAVGIIFGLYDVVSWILVLGVLVIVIAIIGLAAYWKGKK